RRATIAPRILFDEGGTPRRSPPGPDRRGAGARPGDRERSHQEDRSMGQVRRIAAKGVGMRVAMGLGLGLAAFTPGAAAGAEPAAEARVKELAGKRVVPRRAEFVLHDEPGGRGPGQAAMPDLYLVERIEGTSLRVRTRKGPGWAAADQVVPVDRAVE